jgi:hypothetical protein
MNNWTHLNFIIKKSKLLLIVLIGIINLNIVA